MKRTTLKLSLLGLLFLSLGSNAQTKWTLDACITHAMEHNLQVKRQELMSKIAKTNLLQSKTELLPDFAAFGNHTFNNGKALNYDTYEYANQKFQSGNLGIQSEVTLFNGFQLINTISQSRFSLLASLEDLEKVKNDITLSIATAYLQILFDKELLDIAENELDITKLQVQKINRLVEVGNVAKGELLEIKSQEAIEKVNVTNANNNLDLSYITLIQILDLDSANGFDVVVPDNLQINNDNVLNPFLNIYASAESSFPQVKSAEYGYKSAEKGLLLAYGQLSPNLSLNYVRYSRYSEIAVHPNNLADPNLPLIDYPYKSQIKDNVYNQLQFSLNIPIFSKLRRYKNISNAKVDVLDAQYQLDQTKQVLYKEIQQAYANAIASFENYNSRKEAVIAMEEAFNYTQQKFDVGIVNSVDYNISKNNLTKSKSNLLQAKYQYIFKTKVLDFYQGKSIKL